MNTDDDTCGICGGTLDEHDNRFHRAFYEGVAREREDIVAWLRAHNDSCCHFGENAACIIEQGEHHE